MCVARSYEYVLPPWVVGIDADSAESVNRAMAKLNAVLQTFVGDHPFHNYTRRCECFTGEPIECCAVQELPCRIATASSVAEPLSRCRRQYTPLRNDPQRGWRSKASKKARMGAHDAETDGTVRPLEVEDDCLHKKIALNGEPVAEAASEEQPELDSPVMAYRSEAQGKAVDQAMQARLYALAPRAIPACCNAP